MSGVSGGNPVQTTPVGAIGFAIPGECGQYVTISLGNCCGQTASPIGNECVHCDGGTAPAIWQSTCPLTEDGIANSLPGSPFNEDGAQLTRDQAPLFSFGCSWLNAYLTLETGGDNDRLELMIFPASILDGDAESLVFQVRYLRIRSGSPAAYATWRYTTDSGDKDCQVERTLSLHSYSTGMDSEVASTVTVSPVT